MNTTLPPRVWPVLCVLLLAPLMSHAAANSATPRKHPDDLPSVMGLPDLFTSADGSKVAGKDGWAKRRAELLELVQAYEYGHLPPAAPVTASEQPWEPSGKRAQASEQKRAENAVPLPEGATVTQLVLKTGPEGKVSIPVVLTKPAGKGPFPAIIRGDLCWGRVTPAVAAEVVTRGYVLAEFDRTAVVPDENVGRDVGLYALYPDHDFAGLAAWAWGFHRVADYLLTRDDVQKDHIAVTGHSRGGKAALLAGATDERIALTAPNNSGCGGAGGYRYQGEKCETIDVITKRFPYWFHAKFDEFVGKTDRLPIDQHSVKALAAPRALLTTEALGDVWANPEGSQHTYLAAKKAYELLGAADKIGIVFREGGHEHNLADWQVLLDFADKQLAGKSVERKFDQLAFPEYRLASDPNRGTWTQFRGPRGDGTSDAMGLPVEWSEDDNVKWKTEIEGKAWSSPVVLGKQVWLTSATEDGRQLFAICVDRDSGKIVHNLKLFDVEKPQFIHPFNSAGSPTPALEPGRVYVTFGSPGTACLDSETGKVIWERRDFVCNHYRGSGSSPLIYKDLLILNFDGSDYQYVVAMNKHTGETVWKTDRSVDYQDLQPDGTPTREGDFRKAFSTCRVSMLSGSAELISLGSKCLYAYDPLTGKELWRVENNDAHSGSATPVVGDAFVYSCNGLGRKELYAVRPGGKGVVNDTHVAWKVTKNVPGKPSPLLVEKILYLIDDGGIASAVDAQTGQPIWNERIKGNYSASPVYADGKIFFCNEDGLTTVVEAGRTYKLVAENELDEGIMASPAVVDQSLILRTKTHLYRIERKR